MDTEEIIDLIPPFSPSATNSLSAEKWIETIEDLRVIYGWDDRLTLVYASLRLEDGAKCWFKENRCDWELFKVKFVRRYSTRISKEEYFDQLMNRRKEFNESYENYVFDMERTALKCDCSVKNTINYIISGLKDSALKRQLIAMNCRTVDALLSRIKKLTAGHENTDDLRTQLGRSNTSIARDSTEEIEHIQKLCFKCGKAGHYARDCWSKTVSMNGEQKPRSEESTNDIVSRRTVFCVNCKNLGHYANQCPHKEVVCSRCRRKGHKFYDCKYKTTLDEKRMDRRSSSSSFQEHNDENFCTKYKTDGGYWRQDNISNDPQLNVNSDIRRETEQYNSQRIGRDSKSSSPEFCSKCNTRGHHRKDCDIGSREHISKVICKNCNQRDHRSCDCRLKLVNQHRDGRRDERIPVNHEEFCIGCRAKGHLARNCRTSSSFNEKFCHHCRKKGHLLEACHYLIDQKHREERRKLQNSDNFYGNLNTKEFEPDVHHIEVGVENPNNSKVNENFRKDNKRYCRICKSNNHTTQQCRQGSREYPYANNQNDIGKHKEEPKRMCYNCRISGHFAVECPLNNNLKRRPDNPSNVLEHKKTKVENQLQIENNSPKSGLPYASIKITRSLSEFLKPVKIDNVYATALINLASDCTTLQKNAFDKHDWKMEPCNIEINGFGHSLTVSLGKISKNLRVEEVELMTDILIVEDEIQDFPLVLGSNFLDHPSVCVVKKYKSLEIKLVDSFRGSKEPSMKELEPIACTMGSSGHKEKHIEIKIEPEYESESDVEEHLLELLNIIEDDFK